MSHDAKRLRRIQNALHRRYAKIVATIREGQDNANTGLYDALLTKVKKRIEKTPSPRHCEL